MPPILSCLDFNQASPCPRRSLYCNCPALSAALARFLGTVTIAQHISVEVMSARRLLGGADPLSPHEGVFEEKCGQWGVRPHSLRCSG